VAKKCDLCGVVRHHKRAEALVVLAAGRASVEVGAQAGKVRIGVLAGYLQIYVLVEKLEALLASHLESSRTEYAFQGCIVLVV
jgi:hypothetical protein